MGPAARARTDDETGLLAAVGARVRARRERAGLSQEALAERSGHHRNFVGGVERGEQNVSVLGLARLADALGCGVAELLP